MSMAEAGKLLRNRAERATPNTYRNEVASWHEGKGLRIQKLTANGKKFVFDIRDIPEY